MPDQLKRKSIPLSPPASKYLSTPMPEYVKLDAESRFITKGEEKNVLY